MHERIQISVRLSHMMRAFTFISHVQSDMSWNMQQLHAEPKVY